MIKYIHIRMKGGLKVIAAIKTFLSILMAILNLISFPIFGNFTAATEPLDPENCKLNFAAISDIHMTDEELRSFMLGFGLHDMENSKQQLDLLVCAGDLTDHGYAEEWSMLEKSFAKYSPAKEIILAQGNHDTWTEDEGYDLARDLFIEYNEKITGRKTEHEYYSTKVNGYTFIVLASETDRTAACISDAQLAWLAAEMEAAAKDNLPIFVVCHWPLNQTHGLPETWGDDDMEPDDGGIGDQSVAVEEILKKYNNVFMITGHIHSGFSKESQEKINGYVSVESDGSFHSINLPSYMYMTIRGRIANGTGYQLEVYDDRVEVRARSYSAGVWYTDYNTSIPLV